MLNALEVEEGVVEGIRRKNGVRKVRGLVVDSRLALPAGAADVLSPM